MAISNEIEKFVNEMLNRGDALKYIYNNSFNKEKINRVLYSGPYWDKEEIEAIIESVLFGRWLSSGEQVYRFERAFAKKYNQTDALMLNSGSSANLILIAAMKRFFNWKDGDEIIVSPVGFPTTIAPIIQNGLVPVFVDIEFDTLNFDMDKIWDKVTNKTKTIFVSPVLGNTIDIEHLNVIRSLKSDRTEYMPLILDSCDSLGSKYKDKYLNEYFFASTFSFYPAHHITTGEGGMITSDNREFISLARSLSWWGRDCYCVGSANLLPCGTCGHRFDKWLDKVDSEIDHKYVFKNVGYNLKPLDLQGAIGLKQLEKVDEIDEKRKINKKRMEKLFEGILGDLVHIPKEIKDAETSWFGVPVIVKDEIFDGAGMISAKDNKKLLVKHLEDNNIQTRPYFAGNILLHDGYEHLDDYRKYPMANRVLDEVFFVGCHPSYTDDTFNYIEKVLRSWKNVV